MKRLLIAIGFLAASLALPGAARAAVAVYTSASINLRSGPAPDYPRVTRLPAGVQVVVFGCLDGWDWCDIGWRGMRGWVFAGSLYSSYGGQRLFVDRYGPQLGFGVILFSLGNYWDRHYRGRYDWYRDRDHWYRNPPAYHRPPPAYRPSPGYRPPGGGPAQGGPAHGGPPQGGQRDRHNAERHPPR